MGREGGESIDHAGAPFVAEGDSEAAARFEGAGERAATDERRAEEGVAQRGELGGGEEGPLAAVLTHCAMVPQSPETCLWLPVADTRHVLIERQKRMSRVRFKHPIRVVTLEGQPRVIRTLTANVSRKGLFLRMPEPLPLGTKVALSLEAGGRALALAQAEVVWGRVQPSQMPGRFPGCGVRFTEFMHPRAEELVHYLVHNLDRGKPLMLAPPERRWLRWLPHAAVAALSACAALAALILWTPAAPEPLEEDGPTASLELGTISLSPLGERVGERGEPPVAVPTPEPIAAVVMKPEAVVVTTPVSPVEAVAIAKPEPVPEAAAVTKTEAVVAANAPPAAVAKSEPDAKPEPVAKAIVKEQARAATKPEPARTTAITKPAKLAPAQQGTVSLPSGAAASLKWTLTGNELRLAPELSSGAQVTKAFLLTGPARAVFDLSGAAPSKSHQVAAAPPYSSSVRLGKPGSGTRIVIDLDSAPKRSRQDGDALVLSF